jgi:RimJ/RimL family protein N-acetyltransferase
VARAEVKLRDFEPGDAEAVHRWFNDERVTADLVGSRDTFSIEDARGWVARAMDQSRDRKWAITIDGSDDAVGFVALFGLDRQTGPELAVLVGEPAAWGKGVAREAERQACNRAFADHGAHRIHAEIPSTNEAAQKVVTFLGFRREGVMKAAIRRGGDAVDNEIWGLLPADFRGWDEGAAPDG